MEIINSFFCSISVFFFSNIFTLLLLLIFTFLLYYYVISKLNYIVKVLFFTFVALIVAGGMVHVFLPSKEDAMSPIIIASYYLGPIEFLVTLSLLITILFSKFDYNVNPILVNLNSKIDAEKVTEEKKTPVKKKRVIKIKSDKKIEKKKPTKVSKDDKKVKKERKK